MAGWDEFLTDRDRLVYDAAGYGAPVGFGERPVVLVVDVSYGFCGERPEPIVESLKHWHLGAGEEAWQAVEKIQVLIDGARRKRLPVIYATSSSEPVAGGFGLGRQKDKRPPRWEAESTPRVFEIVAPIAPLDTDIVVVRQRPSAFFGSELTAYLIDLGADTIVTCGVSTSGCVRATVTDGYSLAYRMIVVEDCTFDRGQASHWINLFDMQQKYADVLPSGEVLAYFDTLEDDLFVRRMPVLEDVRSPRQPA